MYFLHDVLWNLWHCFCLMRHFVFAWILSDGHGVVLQPACVSQYEFSANSLEWPGHVSHRETVKRPLFWSCGYFCAVQGILGNAQAFRRKHSEMSLPLRFCKNMSSVILLNYSSSLLFSLLMWSTFLSPLTGHHVMSNIYQLWAGECEHVHVCVCVCVVRVWLCAQMRPSRKLLKTLLTSGIPFIMPWFFLELWQNHTQGALWGCCWRSKVRCYNHKSFLRFPQREILAVQLKLDTLCVLSSTVDVIRTSWWWCRQWRCWWWWLWCHEKAGFFAFQVPVSHITLHWKCTR